MFVGFVPVGFVLGKIGFHLDAVAYDVSHLPDVGYDSCGFCLQHDVADGCTLLWSCLDFDVECVGCKLVEVGILRASADDVQDIDGEWGKGFE